MGKPFEKELIAIPGTAIWAFGEPVSLSLKNLPSSLMQYPLIVVGSGGSLSGAHFVAQIHEQVTGKIAKAMTPLEFIYSQIDPNLHAVLFLTASGNNKDIIGAFKRAVKSEFVSIGVICARTNSKISREAKLYPHIKLFEFTNPAGKDGFLAVNSLLSTCIFAAKAYGVLSLSNNRIAELFELKTDFNSREWDSVFQRSTFIALGAEWAWPALIDLESKFTEAALGNVIISDFRNFAHGRHNWFDKKDEQSALLVLETPITKKLAQKTMNLLPAKYPRAVLNSSFSGPMACIHLCIKIFQLVNEAGKRSSIDPGMPKVPEFGRKIYHIGLSPAISKKNKGNSHVWIQRKIRVSNESKDLVENSLDKFLETLRSTRFSGIIFDYDGTLCDLSERFLPLKKEVTDVLNNLLSRNIRIGIATGRGRSTQKNLKDVIDKKYWKKILVGNYNGAVVLPLNEELPTFDGITSTALKKVGALLQDDLLLKDYTKIEIRATQISVSFLLWSQMKPIFNRISEIVSHFDGIKMVHSEHSIDILDSDVSKLNVQEALKATIGKKQNNALTIGDQGQFGGNDFEMLNQPYSLSVNRISTSMTTCWNLSPPGLRGYKATLSILKAIGIEDKTFYLDVDRLEKEIVN
jgi:HAD superfamily hydrolase (TIGR01484 family)